MNFQFNIDYEIEDYFEFNKFHVTRTPEGRKVLIISRLTFAIILGGFALYTLINAYYVIAALFLTALLALEIFFCPLFLAEQKKLIKKLARKNSNGYVSETTLDFSEDTIKESNQLGVFEQKYSILEDIRVLEDEAIYLYNTKTSAYLLPKKAFESEKQYQAFLDFLKTKSEKITFYRRKD